MSPAGDTRDCRATLDRIAGLATNAQGGRGELQARLRAIRDEAQAALDRADNYTPKKRKESKS